MELELKLQKIIGGVEFYGYTPDSFAIQDWLVI